MPVFVHAGERDLVIPLPAIMKYVQRACGLGTHITLDVHSGGHEAAGATGQAWAATRLAGDPPGDSDCEGDEPPPLPDDGDGDTMGVAPRAVPTTATPTFTG